jgi:hypothetical protein
LYADLTERNVDLVSSETLTGLLIFETFVLFVGGNISQLTPSPHFGSPKGSRRQRPSLYRDRRVGEYAMAKVVAED